MLDVCGLDSHTVFLSQLHECLHPSHDVFIGDLHLLGADHQTQDITPGVFSLPL